MTRPWRVRTAGGELIPFGTETAARLRASVERSRAADPRAAVAVEHYDGGWHECPSDAELIRRNAAPLGPLNNPHHRHSGFAARPQRKEATR